MKSIFIFSIVFIFFLSPSFSQSWTIDKAHSQLNFGIRHMGINELDGRFSIMEAMLIASHEDLSDAVITLTADIKSVSTGNETRDSSLKSPDFLDADKYGILSFKSRSFKKLEGKNYELTGDLTLHGITKTLQMNVVFNGIVTNRAGKKISGFKVTGIVNRLEFGICPSCPDAAISDEVTLNANVEFVED